MGELALRNDPVSYIAYGAIQFKNIHLPYVACDWWLVQEFNLPHSGFSGNPLNVEQLASKYCFRRLQATTNDWSIFIFVRKGAT